MGQFDGLGFINENPADTVLWMDFGPDFYAAVSFNDEPDGRRIFIGWMDNWAYAQVNDLSSKVMQFCKFGAIRVDSNIWLKCVAY